MNATIAAFMFPGLFVLVFAGIPVAYALAIVAAGAGYLVFGDIVFQQLYNGVYSAASNFVLAAIPLFVLMGAILERSGVAKRLFQAIQIWLGGLPGGLALATIAMAAVFAAASGIVGAVEILIGLMAIPAMRTYGYRNSLVAGTICAGGSLGTIVPPTVIAVIYASLAQLSIGQLFAAIMIPGLIMVVLFAAYVVGRCILYPQDGPPARGPEFELTLYQKLRVTAIGLAPALVLITSVLGSMLAGIASPTEAAAVGAAGALVLALLYGGFTFSAFREALVVTVRITAMILLIVAGGIMFTGVFAASGGSRMVMSMAQWFGGGELGVILFFLGVTFLLGFVLDWTSIVLICVPIFTPVIRSLGIDPIWFATMMLITLQTSYLTPPMASSIFYLKAIAPADMTYGDMCRGVVPFIVAQLITLGIVAAFPAVATWLPSRIVGF